jgi:hypothetical protein
VYVRNQRLNASQEKTTSSNLADVGWVTVRTRASVARGTPGLVMSRAGGHGEGLRRSRGEVAGA